MLRAIEFLARRGAFLCSHWGANNHESALSGNTDKNPIGKSLFLEI